MSSYSDKLKDPRWQKKRLEVLTRDGFRCQSCGDTETELMVHHIYYDKDFAPWEYQDEAYMTLCKSCHDKWHSIKKTMDQCFMKVDIDQLMDLQGIVYMLKLMGPNITSTFFDIIGGYYDRYTNKEDF
jgi:hypothetical protein